MSDDLVLYDVTDGVATLTFNRPDRLNGMTGNMEVEYFGRLRDAEADPAVRAIVVTGAGRGFCSGADLGVERGPDDQPLPNTIVARTTPLEINKPMIAAINGACAGVGFAYALQCDIRICADDAKITTAFSRRGLIAEYGSAWLLQSIVGRAVALDLLLSARVIRGSEAAALGVVHRAVPVDDVVSEATAYAADLAANVAPAAMATIKRQMMTEPAMTAHDALHDAEALMHESLQGADVVEGVSSFLEKRPVAFAPLGDGTVFGWMRDD